MLDKSKRYLIVGLGLLGGLSGEVDLSRYPLDGPFPELPKSEGFVSRPQMMA